jgi:hypothetical protein
MIVERKCPTCISLAMLGLEKSTYNRRHVFDNGNPKTIGS